MGFSHADADRVGFNKGQRIQGLLESAELWQEMPKVEGMRAALAVSFLAQEAFKAMDAYAEVFAKITQSETSIAENLARLDSPQDGMRLVGEGFCWIYRSSSVWPYWAYYLQGEKDCSSTSLAIDALPMMQALVGCGGARVLLPGEEA